jgi:hypothetical protein
MYRSSFLSVSCFSIWFLLDDVVVASMLRSKRKSKKVFDSEKPSILSLVIIFRLSLYPCCLDYRVLNSLETLLPNFSYYDSISFLFEGDFFYKGR